MHTIAGSGFEWDPTRARANSRRHGITFADVAVVFEDERALTMAGELTAVDEQRFLTLGRDALGRIVVVAYAWRGSQVRISSARPATTREGRCYLARRR